jgi:hypothetical protein
MNDVPMGGPGLVESIEPEMNNELYQSFKHSNEEYKARLQHFGNPSPFPNEALLE